MAIVAMFEITDFTNEKYAKVLTDLEAAGLGKPDGRISHMAAAMEQGIMIVDQWESEAKLGKFAETLVPLIIAAGATPVEPRILQIHNTL